jgi:hypothetical protein
LHLRIRFEWVSCMRCGDAERRQECFDLMISQIHTADSKVGVGRNNGALKHAASIEWRGAVATSVAESGRNEVFRPHGCVPLGWAMRLIVSRCEVRYSGCLDARCPSLAPADDLERWVRDGPTPSSVGTNLRKAA